MKNPSKETVEALRAVWRRAVAQQKRTLAALKNESAARKGAAATVSHLLLCEVSWQMRDEIGQTSHANEGDPESLASEISRDVDFCRRAANDL